MLATYSLEAIRAYLELRRMREIQTRSRDWANVICWRVSAYFLAKTVLNDLEYKGFELKSPKAERIKHVKDFVTKTFLQENDGNLTVMKHLPTTVAQNAERGWIHSGLS